jgi:hypothetical protein
MKDPDSEGTADPTLADPAPADPIQAGPIPTDPAPKGASAEKPEPPRPSAIERQLAATPKAGRDDMFIPDLSSQAGADRIVGQHHRAAKRRPPRFGGVGRFFALIVIVAAGAAFVFSEFGRPLRDYVNAAYQSIVPEIIALLTPAPAAPPSVTSLPVAPPPAAPKPASDNVAPVIAPPVTTSPGALTVSIADVSLRNRPELLEQLVQVYRSQLAANPTESTALAALNQLQQQSFAELETIAAEKDDPATSKALDVISRSFPEQAYKLRYKFLRAQRDQDQREAQAAPPVSALPISETPVSESPASWPANSPASIPAAVTSGEKISPSSTAAEPAASVLKSAQKPAADIAATNTKPQINVVSVTPGTMVEQRFVPGDNGKAFMVEINYRNFINAHDLPDAQSSVTLTALLGTPGDSAVLAEAPVEIAGERGTKSFLMESLVPGDSGERYRLNFILNGRLLASPTVRLQ